METYLICDKHKTIPSQTSKDSGIFKCSIFFGKMYIWVLTLNQLHKTLQFIPTWLTALTCITHCSVITQHSGVCLRYNFIFSPALFPDFICGKAATHRGKYTVISATGDGYNLMAGRLLQLVCHPVSQPAHGSLPHPCALSINDISHTYLDILKLLPKQRWRHSLFMLIVNIGLIFK